MTGLLSIAISFSIFFFAYLRLVAVGERSFEFKSEPIACAFVYGEQIAYNFDWNGVAFPFQNIFKVVFPVGFPFLCFCSAVVFGIKNLLNPFQAAVPYAAFYAGSKDAFTEIGGCDHFCQPFPCLAERGYEPPFEVGAFEYFVRHQSCI